MKLTILPLAIYSIASLLLLRSTASSMAAAAAELRQEQVLQQQEQALQQQEQALQHHEQALQQHEQTLLPLEQEEEGKAPVVEGREETRSIPITRITAMSSPEYIMRSMLESITSMNAVAGGERVVQLVQPSRLRTFPADFLERNPRNPDPNPLILQEDDPLNQPRMSPWLMRPIEPRTLDEDTAYLTRAAGDNLNSPSLSSFYETFLDTQSVGRLRSASRTLNDAPLLLRLQELQHRQKAKEVARARIAVEAASARAHRVTQWLLNHFH